MKVELSFKFEKETKNCYRFKEVVEDKPPIVGTIYLQKSVFESKPEGVRVSIVEEEKKGGGESV